MAAGLHIFFDTTEVAAKPDSPNLGRISNDRLLNVARTIGANLYVPDLVIEEVAYRRLRHFKEQIKDLDIAKGAIERYVKIGVGNPPDDETLLEIFRSEISEGLSKIRITVIPRGLVTLDDVIFLSTRRIPPFIKADDPTGFHDAVILLSILKFAGANAIKECDFVSHDPDHTEHAVKQVGERHGVVCRLWKSSQEIAEMMEKLHDVHLNTWADELFQKTTAFMNAHRAEVQKYVDEHPLKIGDFTPRLGETPIKVLSVTVDRITAVPAKMPENGATCPISLRVHVVSEFLVEVFSFSRPSYLELEARPGVAVVDEFETAEERGILAKALGRQIILPELPVRTRTTRLFEVTLTGTTQAKFENGQFVGRPIIESLAVVKPGSD